MFGKMFKLDEQTLHIIAEFGRQIPGGFYIYRAGGDQELLFANQAVLNIYGCADADEFKALTGYTFSGMVHSEDHDRIAKSILDQIEAGNDKLDYVEYRIIRKDGAVRWVDDYGHYTDTEAYGGIFYVFISDITEKHERMESDLAIRQAVIQALSEAYHTVWLINDVETEKFTLYRGDTKGLTEHAVPIKEALGKLKYSQAKEHYVNTAVAECDIERMQNELSIQNIVKRLNEKPQYNINYLRKMSDGSERYFRVEFAKVNMPGGKMGVVCGFKDVDDDVRKGQAIQQALRDAKRAEDENQRLINEAKTLAKIAELTESMSSLLSNMPALTFSKDVESGRYLACNRLFAEYAHKDSPEDVVGLTDFDIFDQATAKHFAEDDKKAASMDEAYIFYEDVPDAVGVPRKFQTTKFKFTDASGRICTLGMCVDVTELMRIKRETDEAKMASKAKSEFLFNMSHDIRTPMNAITGFTAMAKDHIYEPEKIRDYIDKIDVAGRQLLSLINQVLEMSRIESGKITISEDPVNIKERFDAIVTVIDSQAAEKGLTFKSDLKNIEHNYILADDTRIGQIILNITGNAIKFTPSGGCVDMIFEEIPCDKPGNAGYSLTVRDTGIGMNREFIKNIYEPFSRENTSTVSHIQGTGLGMSIVKELVDLMGGTIKIDSSPGAGTTVIVAFSFKKDESKTEEDKNGPDQPAPGILEGKRILLTDDNEMNREIAVYILEEYGAAVDEADDGTAAVEMIRNKGADYYDTVLMDIQMPHMNGYDATRAIRSEFDGIRHIPVIAMTANAFQEDVQTAADAGMDGHVAKPINVSKMMETISDVLSKYGR